jgi:hypothetical protein
LRRAFPRAEIIEAESAEKGLAVLADRPVSLVITDQKMMSMDGLTFIRTIRASDRGNPTIPIIMIQRRTNLSPPLCNPEPIISSETATGKKSPISPRDSSTPTLLVKLE